MKKLKKILRFALRLIKKIAICVFSLWDILLGTIHFVLCWVFVAITAILEILEGDYNLAATKKWANVMVTPKEYIEYLKNCLKRLHEAIKL